LQPNKNPGAVIRFLRTFRVNEVKATITLASNTEVLKEINHEEAIHHCVQFIPLARFCVRPAQAYEAEQTVINVPFTFRVGATTLPGGEYRIRRVSAVGYSIQSTAEPKSEAMILTFGMSGVGVKPSPAKLVFRAYGGHHFLAQVWMPAAGSGREVPPSAAERNFRREVAKSDAAPQTVAVFAAR
jgi:hypothetical protein